MMSLADRLAEIIRETGPLTVADYMRHCLFDPSAGYYSTRDPFGIEGDFTTAPEISQMFGELIGLALAQAWLDQGSQPSFNLVELGPGRGTLMTDVLRATSQVHGFQEAARVHLVEASAKLRNVQTASIPAEVTHHDTIKTIPRGPIYLIANEFFDALPVRQFVRDGESWRERVIGLADDKLTFGLTEAVSRPDLEERLTDINDGDLVEIGLGLQDISREIGMRTNSDGGVAYIIDYGDWRSLGDTLQAVRDHQSVSPLEAPGSSDLTAHVDFEALARAAIPAKTSRITPQGVFLERLGITERARALAAKMSGPTLDSHIAAHRRLTHPQEMGTLFKVMAVYPTDAPLPPGVTA